MPKTVIIGIILAALAWGVDVQASSPQKVARTSGVMTIGGTPHPYHAEGSGVTCIVTGFAPFSPQQYSDGLKQHIRFVYVDFKNSWGAEAPRDVKKITMSPRIGIRAHVWRRTPFRCSWRLAGTTSTCRISRGTTSGRRLLM